MPTLRQINQTLDDATSLQIVSSAYSEIAAIKLQKIRSGIERNRNFFAEISQVFRMVKVAASKRKINLTVKTKGAVSILLTSNHHFYGNIERRLINYFTSSTTGMKTDLLVTGSVGNDFMRTTGFPHPFESLVFSDDLPKPIEIQDMVNHIKDYQQIFVFYPRMQSVLVQEPYVVDLLQRPPERLLVSQAHHFQSIFEPELDQILQFFDSQIIMLLAEQIFLESELARTASRLVSMGEAQEKAKDMIKDQKHMVMQARRSVDNLRLLDTIASLPQWRKEPNV